MISDRLPSVKSRLVGGVATGLAYFTLSSHFFPLVSGANAAAPMWIPSGIAAAGAVVFGLWVVPFVFLGSLLAALRTSPVPISGMMAFAAAFEIIVFNWLLRRAWAAGTVPRGLGRALGIGGAMVLAPLSTAVIEVAHLAISNTITDLPALNFARWWLSEVAGIGAISGIAILWTLPLRTKPTAQRIEAASAIAVTIAAAAVLYWIPLPQPVSRAVPFVFLPLFTWIAFRCEARSMGITIAIVSIISTVATMAGHGPFAGVALDDSLLALNLVISVFAFSSLALAVLVADHKRSLAALEAARMELESAARAKDHFLANMSHELRTPLNSVIGFSDMLLSGLVGELEEEQARQVGMINNSGRHLLSLVNDILDLSRIASGRVSVEPEEFRPREVAESVLDAVRPMAAKKNLAVDLEFEIPDEAIATDRRKVHQVLLNLVGNAVKFTDVGGVVLRVECDDDSSIIFSVKDSGIGIREDDLSHVFEEFSQLASHEAGKPEGTGLGLAISLRLARILGGDMSVASQVGVGSTFTFSLPAVLCCEPAGCEHESLVAPAL